MSKEISDSVEINGKAVLRLGAPRSIRSGYLDGCHAEIKDNPSFLPSDLPTQMGFAATKAGYQIGEEFEYTITIAKKR